MYYYIFKGYQGWGAKRGSFVFRIFSNHPFALRLVRAVPTYCYVTIIVVLRNMTSSFHSEIVEKFSVKPNFVRRSPGLPDRLFSNQKSKFG
jgi:hypothetical protein